jgi:hypothetical protein
MLQVQSIPIGPISIEPFRWVSEGLDRDNLLTMAYV